MTYLNAEEKMFYTIDSWNVFIDTLKVQLKS